LKNAHLLRSAANLIAQRISIYASLFGFLRALHLSIFEQPEKQPVSLPPLTPLQGMGDALAGGFNVRTGE